jgi:predicted nucleic acid-binding protein
MLPPLSISRCRELRYRSDPKIRLAHTRHFLRRGRWCQSRRYATLYRSRRKRKAPGSTSHRASTIALDDGRVLAAFHSFDETTRDRRVDRRTGARRIAMSYLLDTTALLAHYLDEPGGTDVQRILEGDDSVFVCSVSAAEFARRLVVLGCEVDFARSVALEYLELCDETLSVDAAVAIRAFEIGATAGERVPLIDAIIASAAQTKGATLVHRDTHFESMPSVDRLELSSSRPE